MTHHEADELLGAYALDAVDGEERADFEAHLTSCPRCRVELDALREVAAAMGTTVERPPESLWPKIAGSVGGGAPPSRVRPPVPPPLRGSPADRSSWARRAGRRQSLVLGALATAAVVVALVLGLSLAHADRRIGQLQSAARRPAPVAEALATPGHRLVELRTSSQAEVARLILVPDGRGYLVSSALPSLGGGRTYQLWGIVGRTPISLGLLGSSPRQAAFTHGRHASGVELRHHGGARRRLGGAHAPDRRLRDGVIRGSTGLSRFPASC